MSKQVTDGKFRFGVLDAVILIIVIALMATVVFRFTTDIKLFAYNTEKYAVTIRAEGLQYTTVDMILPTDNVYFENGDLLGTFLTSPTVTPKMVYELSSEGDLIPAYYPDNTLVNIITTIECDLVESDDMLVTKSGEHLAAGVTFLLHTQTLDLYVEVIGIEKIEP